MTAARWPAALDEHERAIEADCVPLDTMRGRSLGAAAVVPPTDASLASGNDTDSPPHGALDQAQRCIARAAKADEAGVHFLVPGYLAEAADALRAAGLPELAARCDDAAEPFGAPDLWRLADELGRL